MHVRVDRRIEVRAAVECEAQLARSVEKGKLRESDKTATLERLHGTTRLADLGGCDLVIEAATENLDAKKKVFAELDGLLAPSALLTVT